MNKPTYQTYNIDVSAVAATVPALQPIILVFPGRAISSVLVRLINPVSQVINLHFGPASDPMPVYQGEVFGEDHTGPQFDAGLYWSYSGAVAAGTVLAITVFYADDSAQ